MRRSTTGLCGKPDFGSASVAFVGYTAIMKCYEYRHLVSFDETNVVGNVYFVHFFRWQGLAREMFLREKCPEVVDEFARGLALVTTHVSCEYLAELVVFDEILLRMYLQEAGQSQIAMRFEYWRLRDGREELVARGDHRVAAMRRDGASMTPTPLPDSLRRALQPYRPA
jgi:enediyne biosynthesis thioesterase